MTPTPWHDAQHDPDCRYIRWPFWLRGLRPYDTARCERCRRLKALRRR